MADNQKILVVAFSGRALAAAAKRAGYAVSVVDLFGDADMKSLVEDSRVVEGTPAQGFEPAGLLATADALAPPEDQPRSGVVYGAGLEAQTDLLTRLCEGRRLYGNAPETVARVKDPVEFFGTLDRLGVAHPSVRFSPPTEAGDWLVKRAGGSGGFHVTRHVGGSLPIPGVYYQRTAQGRPIGVSFLADGHRSLIIGLNEQWHDNGDPDRPFRFSGALHPAVAGRALRRDIQQLLDAIVVEWGLVGLNNVDVIDDGETFAVLEVNPRAGANLDIFDHGHSAGLFASHIAACEGRLPDSWRLRLAATAMTVIYSDRQIRIAERVNWPEWVVDRPASGAAIEQGMPVCTVLATGETEADVRRLIATRVAFVRSEFLAPAPDRRFNRPQPKAEAVHA